MTEASTVSRAADVLIDRATQFRSKRSRIHFGIVMPDRKTPPTVPHMWRRMNMFGVTFPRAELDEARAWAVAAITAGYRPYVMFRKGASGFAPTEMLELLRPASDD